MNKNVIIGLVLCFIQTVAMASQKDIFNPVDVDTGHLDVNLEFQPESGVDYIIRGVAVPTTSNFFIYEDGQPYMTHVERSQSRLRKINFVNGDFKSEPFKGKLNKPLMFKLDYIHSVVYKGNKHISPNCNSAIIEKSGSASEAIKINGFGIIKSTLPIEFMNCNLDGSVLIGVLHCFRSGYCRQALWGIKKLIK